MKAAQGPAQSLRRSTKSARSKVSKKSSMLPLPVRQIQFPLRLSPRERVKARTRIRQQLQRRNLTPLQAVEQQLKQAKARLALGLIPQSSLTVKALLGIR